MLQKETFRFLKGLGKNNNKAWFEKNRPAYQDAKENFEEFVEGIIKGVGVIDKDIAVLIAKSTIFRQNRDIRFSANKTPYKIHMGAYLNKGTKKINTPGYYIHLEPGKSMIGAGLYQPEPPVLAKVRQEIDYNQEEWLKLMTSRELKKYFKTIPDTSDRLTRAPKGYEETNPVIDFLKLKSFVVTTPLKDEEVFERDFQKKIIRSFTAAKALIDFLQRAYE